MLAYHDIPRHLLKNGKWAFDAPEVFREVFYLIELDLNNGFTVTQAGIDECDELVDCVEAMIWFVADNPRLDRDIFEKLLKRAVRALVNARWAIHKHGAPEPQRRYAYDKLTAKTCMVERFRRHRAQGSVKKN